MNFEQHTVEVLKWGDGPFPVFAFHGFGQQPDFFKRITPAFPEKYRFYAIGLFYHGSSALADDAQDRLDAGFYTRLIRQICAEENIQRFGLMGNSLGGRLALHALPALAENLDELILLAPDGVKKNFWYAFATTNPLGKRLFKHAMMHPSLLFRIVACFRFAGLLSPSMEKFVRHQFSDKANREKVWHVWNLYAVFEPEMEQVRGAVYANKIPVYAFTGRYDPVVSKRIGPKLKKLLGAYCTWNELETGHELLKPSLANEIERVLATPIHR